MALDVLIVDDSAAIRKILIRVLAQADIGLGDPLEAGDGVEALKAMETKSIGLVLCDINMPNMDGLQFLAAVRARPEWKHIPVIMITTEGSQNTVLEALKLGAQGYVRKPFTAEQIKEKITACVRKPS